MRSKQTCEINLRACYRSARDDETASSTILGRG